MKKKKKGNSHNPVIEIEMLIPYGDIRDIISFSSLRLSPKGVAEVKGLLRKNLNEDSIVTVRLTLVSGKVHMSFLPDLPRYFKTHISLDPNKDPTVTAELKRKALEEVQEKLR